MVEARSKRSITKVESAGFLRDLPCKKQVTLILPVEYVFDRIPGTVRLQLPFNYQDATEKKVSVFINKVPRDAVRQIMQKQLDLESWRQYINLENKEDIFWQAPAQRDGRELLVFKLRVSKIILRDSVFPFSLICDYAKSRLHIETVHTERCIVQNFHKSPIAKAPINLRRAPTQISLDFKEPDNHALKR